MVVTRIIENVIYRVVHGGVIAVPSHVVRDHVDHKILRYVSACPSPRTNDQSTYHASLVQGIGQALQVLCSSKIRVDLVDSLWPESMESPPVMGVAWYLLCNG